MRLGKLHGEDALPSLWNELVNIKDTVRNRASGQDCCSGRFTSGKGGVTKPFSIRDIFGWKTLEGQVIHVEPPYMARVEFSLGRLLLKLSLFIVALIIIGPIIIGVLMGVLLAVVIISIMLSFLFPQSSKSGPGFFSSISHQVAGFFLSKKLFGPKAESPVRDIRLRDVTGQEHLVRIRGDIVAGSVNVGDEITVEGFDHRGTLKFSRGWNKRIRSEIRVKSR